MLLAKNFVNKCNQQGLFHCVAFLFFPRKKKILPTTKNCWYQSDKIDFVTSVIVVVDDGPRAPFTGNATCANVPIMMCIPTVLTFW